MSLPLTRTSVSQNFPFPRDGETVYENPPCLIWVPIAGETVYTVTVRTDAGDLVFQAETPLNYIYDRRAWDAGGYVWNVRAANGEERGEWRFEISREAVSVDRPDAQTVYDSVPADRRPRHLFFREDIPALLAEHPHDMEILRRNAEMAYRHGLPSAPKFHWDSEALPYREYFGAYRDYCDRDMIACALLYTLTGDEKAGAHAKALLLTICDMNPLGPCCV